MASAHPYIPNLAQRTRQRMLKEIGLTHVGELFRSIPDRLIMKEPLNIPPPLASEYALKRHIQSLLSKNVTCQQYKSFLGAGCYHHYVPAVCDEISQRGEFLTAYTGDTYEDHGRWQALFEYASLMGELLQMDAVNVPTYDWAQAAATSIRMACRITERTQALVSAAVGPERLSVIKGYCAPDIDLRIIPFDVSTGQIDLNMLSKSISDSTAAVYFENPNYFGLIETQGQALSRLCKARGAVMVTGVDPLSLGVLAPPVCYGAEIVCGDLQPLGVHMNYGGGLSGFIASSDEQKYVMQYPSRLVGITKTSTPGQFGFGEVAFSRTSFIEREHGREYVGTGTSLCAIIAAVYLALMGPIGMKELGLGIMQRTRYAMSRISQIPGVRLPLMGGPHFKEFIIDLNLTGKSTRHVNERLLKHRIIGGKDLSQEFPVLGQSALYCITEMHTKSDIDELVEALAEVVGS